MSPELILPQQFGFEKSRPTKSSDCYALGMVIYETISGNMPFHQHTDLTVFAKVLAGERPPREARFTESLWKMLELCWAPQPNNRPSIEDILQCLEMVADLPAPHSGVDEEIEDGDDWDSECGSSDVPNGASGTMKAEGNATTSPNPSFSPILSAVVSSAVEPISEADVEDLPFPSSGIDSNDEGTRQASAI
jgi:serine/threonine protein kinase